MADEVHPERHPPSADAVEKSVARGRDDQAPDARRRLEPRVVPVEEESHVSELYRLAAVQFAERSCAAREVAETWDAREPLGKRRLKLEEAQQPPEAAPRAALPDARAEALLAPMGPVATMPPEQ
jgi:hypothetical protein